MSENRRGDFLTHTLQYNTIQFNSLHIHIIFYTSLVNIREQRSVYKKILPNVTVN